MLTVEGKWVVAKVRIPHHINVVLLLAIDKKICAPEKTGIPLIGVQSCTLEFICKNQLIVV